MQAPLYHVVGGVRYYVANGTLRVYVPEVDSLRSRLMHELHGTPIAGHFGHERVHAALDQSCFLPDMPTEVKQHCHVCPVCQHVKSTAQPRIPIQPLPVMSHPYEQNTLDWLTGFPPMPAGCVEQLLISSRSELILPCSKGMPSEQLTDVLHLRVLSWADFPVSIVCDRDSCPTASAFPSVCKQLAATLKMQCLLHTTPKLMGKTESLNNTFLGSAQNSEL
jgi:hypothetical protein